LIDLHLHLLPGVDDGAGTLEQAVEMAAIAAADGCRALIVTPHQRRDEWENSDPRHLADRLAEVAARLPRQGNEIVPRLLLGGEVRVDSDLLGDLARPGHSGVQPLAGSRYLLLEFEPYGVGPDPVEIVSELLAEGWWPIVAHPEVVPYFWESEDDLLARLVEAGALFQVTAMSITGEFGKETRARVWELLRAGCVQFVASDSHRPDWRPPGLARARQAVAAELGAGLAEELTVTNPLAVVEDRPISNVVPILGSPARAR
jgi:protein-tyrosine phosphatase